MDRVRVAVQGFGPIGREAARKVSEDKEKELVCAIDIDKKYVDKSLSDLFGINSELEVKHAKDAGFVFMDKKPDVLVLATATELEDIYPPIETAAICGVNVIASSEKLFNTKYEDSEIADDIDAIACTKGIRVLGTGVNPGCLLDTYVVKLVESGGYNNIFRVEAKRIDDTRNRRLSLLEKTGAKKTPLMFEILSKEGKLGHSGLEASADYIAKKMQCERYNVVGFRREPVFAKKDVETKHMGMIYEGEIAGLKEICNVEVYNPAHYNWVVRVSLELQMYAGAKNSNSVDINCKNIVNHTNLVNGDEATVRILHDAIKHITEGYVGLNGVDYRPDPAVLLVE